MKKKLSFMMVALFAIASFAVQYSHSIEDAPASLGLTTVAELTALADKAEFTYAAPLEIQAMPKKGNNVYCYVKDNTGWTLIYDAGGSKTAGLEVGKKIAGNWNGAVSIYNGLFEVVPAAALTATEDPAVTPTFETVPVTAVTAENVNKIVKLEGVTVAAVNGKRHLSVCTLRCLCLTVYLNGFDEFRVHLPEHILTDTFNVLIGDATFRVNER